MQIRVDDLSGREIRALLAEHLQSMHRLSPPESVHALDLAGLLRPEITFWTIWDGEELLGCGALKEVSASHGEVKSMHTAENARRRGVATALMRQLLAAARQAGLTRLSLETGSWDYFEPARAFYRRHGFRECAPFAHYRVDPNSVFMTREL